MTWCEDAMSRSEVIMYIITMTSEVNWGIMCLIPS